MVFQHAISHSVTHLQAGWCSHLGPPMRVCQHAKSHLVTDPCIGWTKTSKLIEYYNISTCHKSLSNLPISRPVDVPTLVQWGYVNMPEVVWARNEATIRHLPPLSLLHTEYRELAMWLLAHLVKDPPCYNFNNNKIFAILSPPPFLLT